MNPYRRKIAATAVALYTLLILFFMFFAFDRTSSLSSEFTFMLVPSYPPLSFPQPTFSWLFDFGNVVAFIPFGMLIPYLWRWSYARFFVVFVLAIAALETLQGLTRLGSFDIDDIISNTLGASIGYAAWRFGFRSGRKARQWTRAVLSVVVMLIVSTFVSEGIEAFLKKSEGPFKAISVQGQPNAAAGSPLPVFSIGSESVSPRYNVITAIPSGTYTLKLGHLKNVRFFAEFGIPDDKAHEGSVTLFADGRPFVEYSGEYISGLETVIVPFDRIDELKIVLEGNAVLWDVGYREMKHWWE